MFAHLRSENSLHWPRLRRDNVDLEFSVNQRSRNLHRNEARAYQYDAPSLGGLANNRAAIIEGAQVANLRRVSARNHQLHRLRARRQQQRIKFAIAAIDELDALLLRIDRRDPRVQEQFDLVLTIEVHRAQREPFLARSTG